MSYSLSSRLFHLPALFSQQLRADGVGCGGVVGGDEMGLHRHCQDT